MCLALAQLPVRFWVIRLPDWDPGGPRGCIVCRMHGARGGAPEGKRNGNYRHGGRTKEMIEVWKLIKSLR
jgi:hypothetical protein